MRLADIEHADIEVYLVKRKSRFLENLRITPCGSIGTALAHQQGHAQLCGSIGPDAEGGIVAATPRVEGDSADERMGIGVVQGGNDEAGGGSVGRVTQQHPGGQPAAAHLTTHVLDERRMLLGSVEDIDAEVGLVEGEQGGLDAIVFFEIDQIVRQRGNNALLLGRVEPMGGHALPTSAARRGIVDGPHGREPAADDDGHALRRQPLCHLHALADVLWKFVRLRMDERGVFVGMPLAPRHLYTAIGHTDIV